jgi:mono/diheme cytochrome c family protein
MIRHTFTCQDEKNTMKSKWMMGVLGAATVAGAVLVVSEPREARAQATGSAPQAQKAAPPPAGAATAAIERGRYIAVASDCIACHTAPKSRQPFGGGYALETPFGNIIASNITPDKEAGIGAWSEAEFTRAVRLGKGKHGQNLYPAMPYTAYVKLTDADMHDLWAYMQTVTPVAKKAPETALPFPFNIRLLMSGWNMLFFDNAPFKPDTSKSAMWNRGSYLVNGAGHCAACHTGKNFLGGDKGDAFLQGGVLAGWYAPEITGNSYVGIGGWSQQELVQYLKIGSNSHASAAGPMAEAVTNSTQHMTDPDLQAIAVYLQSVKGSTLAKPAALVATEPAMVRGKHVYEANCAACHDFSGKGVSTMVSSLAGGPAVQAPHTESLVRTVLVGDRGAVTRGNPTGAAMPAFAWKLDDADVAAALTYARNSWGNAAPAVTADTVKHTRAELKAPSPNLTVIAAH